MARVIRVADGIAHQRQRSYEIYQDKKRELEKTLEEKRNNYKKSFFGKIKLFFLDIFELHEEQRKIRELTKEYTFNLNLYDVGEEGEKKAESLFSATLPDSYLCIAGIPLKNCDIDFLIIGPTGIFAIEVKNYKGIITIKDDKLFHYKVGRRGTIYIGHGDITSEIKLLKSNIHKIKCYLKSEMGHDFYISGIIFFVNENISIEVPNNEFMGIKLCDFSNIIENILESKPIPEKNILHCKIVY